MQARIVEDDNFMDMTATDDLLEFPSEGGEGNNSQSSSEDELSDDNEDEPSESGPSRGRNDNATCTLRSRSNTPLADGDFSADQHSTQRSEIVGEGNNQLRVAVSMTRDHTRRSVETQGQPSLKQAFNQMQNFMLHKGLITADSLRV